MNRGMRLIINELIGHSVISDCNYQEKWIPTTRFRCHSNRYQNREESVANLTRITQKCSINIKDVEFLKKNPNTIVWKSLEKSLKRILWKIVWKSGYTAKKIWIRALISNEHLKRIPSPSPPPKKKINSNTKKLKDSQDFPSQYNTSKHESQIILKFTFNVTMYVDLISVKLLDSLVIHVGQWFG